MIRKAFRMTLYPGQEAEYTRRHSPIWPELEATLKSHGAHNYSIFLDRETNALFAYVEIESQERWDAVAQTEVCRRWWAMMKDIMASHTDNSPVAVELTDVFYLE